MHIPVLLNEVLQYLDPKPNENFIDCTVGEGGHALAILALTAPNGIVLGIDRDADMVERLREKAERLGVSERLLINHGNFISLREISRRETVAHNFGSAAGVLFDFGMSTWQLQESGAGFSFQNIEPLDMRFDRSKDTETAASILNSWPEESISRIIAEFGEERCARRIAREITIARKKDRIRTTDQLVAIIGRALPIRQAQGKPTRRGKIHSATRTFQALRIAVNSELENLEKGINEAINLLSSGGRIAAISFHSLEDRRVKQIFRGGSSSGFLKIVTKKPVRPAEEEIRANPRARSAKLRVTEKI